MPEKKALAEYLKAARRERNQSQLEFAMSCGIDKETLGAMERKKANPSLLTLQKIAACTGSTVAEMLAIQH